MAQQIKVRIWELDSKGKERITAVQTFDNRADAYKFIENNTDEPCKPLKMEKGVKYAQETHNFIID